MRITKDRMLNEAHTPQRDLPIRDLLARMHHDGCGGRPGRAELLTGIEGASSRPVRKIVCSTGGQTALSGAGYLLGSPLRRSP
jgi:hypothetical protein